MNKAAHLYLDLLKKNLTDTLRDVGGVEYQPLDSRRISLKRFILFALNRVLVKRDYEIVRRIPYNREKRLSGKDWPTYAETMIGIHRLDNIQECVTQIMEQGIPGDFIEAGVWRGGAAIFMRALLKAFDVADRVVWAADSFQGLPKPEQEYPDDNGDRHYTYSDLKVSLDDVKNNFQRYGLLDDQVKFLAGWFKDTLPVSPIQTLALLRLDGDMYGSTIVSLENLYSKLSPGGYIIIDDYSLEGCRKAVDDFRREHHIEDDIERVDHTAVYWRKNKI